MDDRYLLLGTPLRCSSVTAPALPYYRPSMDMCIALISYILATMHCSTTVRPVHITYIPVGTKSLATLPEDLRVVHRGIETSHGCYHQKQRKKGLTNCLLCCIQVVTYLFL